MRSDPDSEPGPDPRLGSPCRSAAGGCADAGAVAVGVLDNAVRRRSVVADEAPPCVQDGLQASFGLVVGNPHVEVPALFERLLWERQRLVVAVRFLRPSTLGTAG